MCKIKEYKDATNKYLNSILLRLDTYLLPDDIEKVLYDLRDKSKGTPSEIPFDDINEQIIDIDSVAELHNAYINTILDTKKIYTLKNTDFNGVELNIYLNKFFIAFEISKNDQNIEDAVNAIRNSFLNTYNMSIDFGYLRLSYSNVDIDNNNLWNVFDKSAFPVMDGAQSNGFYVDTVSDNNIDLDLIRSISPSSEYAGSSNVNIQTKAIFQTKSTAETSDKVLDAVSFSKREATRCFT